MLIPSGFSISLFLSLSFSIFILESIECDSYESITTQMFCEI